MKHLNELKYFQMKNGDENQIRNGNNSPFKDWKEIS